MPVTSCDRSAFRSCVGTSSFDFLFPFFSLASELLDGLKDNQYGIGYLDADHGHDFGLSEVALTNLAGKTRTSKESIALGGVAEAVTAAANGNVFPTDVSADWSRDLAEAGCFWYGSSQGL